MKAVVYKGNGEIALEDRPVPKILDDRDAIIKVTLTTICSSDIHIKHGAVPRAVPGTILGHEFVGRVVETGSAVKKIKPGDRVSVNVETFCGECFFCKREFVNNCTDPDGGWALGCRIDGGQAEYVRIPFADNGLTVIPDHVSDEQALFNGDILSTGYWAAKIGELNPADTVAVIGAGPTGLCTMMCARLYTPARIIAIDTNEYRLNLAKEKGLADITLVPGRDDPEKVIKELTDAARILYSRSPEGRIHSRPHGRSRGRMRSLWLWRCMKKPRSFRFRICTGRILFSRQAAWTAVTAGRSWI